MSAWRIFLSFLPYNISYFYTFFWKRYPWAIVAKRKETIMQEDEKAYRDLFAELSEFERYGIHMRIDGECASPLQIAAAHMVKEKSTYMRDYILDEDGHVEELCFNKVKSLN